MIESEDSLTPLEEADVHFVNTFIDKKLIPTAETFNVTQSRFTELWEDFMQDNDHYTGVASIEHVRDELLTRLQNDIDASNKSFLDFKGTKLSSNWNTFVNLVEIGLDWSQD